MLLAVIKKSDLKKSEQDIIVDIVMENDMTW